MSIGKAILDEENCKYDRLLIWRVRLEPLVVKQLSLSLFTADSVRLDDPSLGRTEGLCLGEKHIKCVYVSADLSVLCKPAC